MFWYQGAILTEFNSNKGLQVELVLWVPVILISIIENKSLKMF